VVLAATVLRPVLSERVPTVLPRLETGPVAWAPWQSVSGRSPGLRTPRQAADRRLRASLAVPSRSFPCVRRLAPRLSLCPRVRREAGPVWPAHSRPGRRVVCRGTVSRSGWRQGAAFLPRVQTAGAAEVLDIARIHPPATPDIYTRQHTQGSHY